MLILWVVTACNKSEPIITTNTLLDELTNLERLTYLPEIHYKTIQFSSYDRRSKSPTDTTWFCNEDGFGGEPIPGFEKTLKQPVSNGIGEYLICDVQSPGVIQRLWTAEISGKIRFFLDDLDTPVYEGNAQDFFWKPLKTLLGINDSVKYAETFRQFDATFLPIPFAKRCRIEWIGNINNPHFYHVGVRLYKKGTRVEPFSRENFNKYSQKFEEINMALANPNELLPTKGSVMQHAEFEVSPNSTKELFNLNGQEAIEFFKLKFKNRISESSLRNTVLNIYFDNSSAPQVQSPIGDFFGAAPGINPYQSLPLAVLADSSMICRFVMPFSKSARIEVVNSSSETISFSAGIRTTPYQWEDGKSLYFHAKWSINYSLTAWKRDSQAMDIQYIKAKGCGRLVGAAAYLYNPCQVPTSWGNWWGEGDEKIFVDRDTFPSFFGTGSEDYFNYSWSSPKLFAYPYCGQPRNDGPNNRGYVANFRWHIVDDITFAESLDFCMELRHHDNVPNFDYGRIVYFYALPSTTVNSKDLNTSSIKDIQYSQWSPKAYLGCADFRFTQAELLADKNQSSIIEKGEMWAEGNILTWKPKLKTESLKFNIQSVQNRNKTRIGFTIAHSPYGGSISFLLNGKPIKIDDNDTLSLFMQFKTVLDNHFTELVDLKEGNNVLVIKMLDADDNRKAQIDFVWLIK